MADVVPFTPAPVKRENLATFDEEKALLGQILLSAAVPGDVAAFLRPEHFSDPLNGLIFQRCTELQARGERVTGPALHRHFRDDDVLKNYGGAAKYFGELLRDVEALVESGWYARHIRDTWARRKMVEMVAQITTEVAAPTADRSALDLVRQTQAALKEFEAEIIHDPWSRELVVATPFPRIEASELPTRDFLLYRHFVRGFVSMTVSTSGIGKSLLLLLDAVSLAIGRNLLTGETFTPRRVWVFNGEDPSDELKRRVVGILLHYGLTWEDLGGRLFLDSGREQRIEIARDDRRTGVVIARPLVESLIRTIKAQAIDVVILDPFISTHGVGENDNGAIDMVAKELATVADKTNCAVEVVHHVRKTNGLEITAEDARGSSALIAAARSVRVLNIMSGDEAAKAGIAQDQRRAYFRVDTGKANLTPPAAGAGWRQLVSVSIGNGSATRPSDHVGVVTAWSWPDSFAGLTTEHLRTVQNRVGGGTWRADAQASAWVGRAIAGALQLDIEDAASKARVKVLLKTWLASGALVELDRMDAPSRKMRRFVEVGRWVD